MEKPSILIVDDTPSNIKTLSAALKDEYRVTAATTGEEALSLVSGTELPDLIILDIMMPGISGHEVCKALKSEERTRHIPVIFVTSMNEEVDETTGFELGAVDYIRKPFSIPVVKKRVDTHVQLKRYKDYLEEIVAQRTEELSRSNQTLRETNVSFSRFVPTEFLSILSKSQIMDVKLGDHVLMEMGILFADIRSFATLSERMTPRENFLFINDYLGTVVPIILEHGGFVDKYIGDAVLALFPNSADAALAAAVAMQEGVHRFNEKRSARKEAPIAIGIGLHWGNLMLGVIGVENRLEGTVISDAVNLASRIESTTKEYGAPIIVSEEFLLQVKNKDAYSIRFLNTIQVKGRMLPVSIYEILNGENSEIQKLKQQAYPFYEEGWRLLCDGQVREAYAQFVLALEIYPEDKAAKFHLSCCTDFLEES